LEDFKAIQNIFLKGLLITEKYLNTIEIIYFAIILESLYGTMRKNLVRGSSNEDLKIIFLGLR